MLRASQYLTYPHIGPSVGTILGPSLDEETYWMVVDKQPDGDKVRVGLYAMDTPEAAAEAATFRASI